MSKSKLFASVLLSAMMALAAVQPAAAADRKTTNTILGAGIGAAAGAVLSQGDTLTTLGGAAAGGVLGNILTEEPRKHRHASRPHNSRRPVHHRGKPHHANYANQGKGKWKHHHKGHKHHHR